MVKKQLRGSNIGIEEFGYGGYGRISISLSIVKRNS